MFEYEYEKRTPNPGPSRGWRAYDRPLPPRPGSMDPPPAPAPLPIKTTVPLRVWIISSMSCLGVCAALVLATVAITKWGAEGRFQDHVYAEPIFNTYPKQELTQNSAIDGDIQMPILEKLPIFKNVVASREHRNDLLNKPQIHPVHDLIHHTVAEKKIEKKHEAKLPESITKIVTKVSYDEAKEKINELLNEDSNTIPHKTEEHKNGRNIPVSDNTDLIPEENKKSRTTYIPIADSTELPNGRNIPTTGNTKLPEFKPILPVLEEIKLPENFLASLENQDYEEYYNDENLYNDYIESNSMTSYLLEKIQELHDWITTDPDFEKVGNHSKVIGHRTEFSQLLQALNTSLHGGNVTIMMNKLREMYYGENYTNTSPTKKIILTNSTDMFSFGILTLDVMLLHNIQLMAWESQESARVKMLKDPEVFAFNALFMDPGKVQAKQDEIIHGTVQPKRQTIRQTEDDFDLGKNLFENVLEVGMSAARAAIHLGRAYKNTRNILTQLSNREPGNTQSQISRNIDGNTQALNHLQTSYNRNDSVANNGTFYTELDCIWLLYCRNLVSTSKLNAPFGTMARINGVALRMLSGELSADRALDTMLYEALAGWTELKCDEMFPRCTKVNAANVVMESILQPLKKSQAANRSQ